MNNDIYITYICNYDQEKMIQRIYQINSLTTNNYYIDFMIKIHIFNNYLLLGSNGFTNEEKSFSSLIIFSYPNMEDRNIELSDYLLYHNEVNINNITLELNNLCIVENNIFGFLLTDIKILKINKTSIPYFSLFNETEIIEDMIIPIEENLKLVIPKAESIYEQFSYGIKYACLATEPDYEEYNEYPIYKKDTGIDNKEDSFFQKQTYTGKSIYYNLTLDNKLTDEGCESLCILCNFINKDKCITCIEKYDILDNNKFCLKEVNNTIIETTIPDTTSIRLIETTIPRLQIYYQ